MLNKKAPGTTFVDAQRIFNLYPIRGKVYNKDAEYEDAVNAGDFSKARELLKQTAAEKG